MKLHFVLLGLHPLQPGELVLQPGDLLLRSVLLLGVLLARGVFFLEQFVELGLTLQISLPKPLRLSFQPADDLRIRLWPLRSTCTCHEES